MEYRLLGSSGCAVSALALGTLTFGNETDQDTSFSQLDRFAQLLDEASEPPAPDYPYGVPGQSQRSRRIRGGRF
jgi:hypothetical protein